MLHKKEIGILIFILVITAFLRFYNLMHDTPYFFNPDERNMAIAVSQFRLPSKLSEIPICLISQMRNDPGSSSRGNDLGSSVTNNCNLNPHFFAYGQFPLYLAYASDQVTKPIFSLITNYELPTTDSLSTSFPSAIFWLRFWSALSSTFTVLLVYLITKETIITQVQPKNSKGFSYLAALSAAFTPGLIQAAHFGTTESLLTFFFLASLHMSLSYLSLSRSKSRDNLSHLRYLLFSSLVIGLALGTKLTGLFFFIPPLLVLIIRIIGVFKKKRKSWLLGYCLPAGKAGVIGLLLIFGTFFFFLLSSPYNLIDFAGFKGSAFGYEAEVATGRYQAFYTRQFVDTIPILFQIEKIFPYALGWPLFILGTLGLLLINLQLLSKLLLSIISKVQSSKFKVQKLKVVNYLDFKNLDLLWILTLGFWIYFLPNAFLFAKWTRFMTPIFPFFTIFAGYFLFQIFNILIIAFSKIQNSKSPRGRPIQNYKSKVKNFPLLNFKLSFDILRILSLSNGYFCLLPFVFCLVAILPGIAFMSIYAREDSRVTASKWIYQNIPNNSYLLSETANVVDIPLSLPTSNFQLPTSNLTIISFDFYHLEENLTLFEQLLTHLEKANYILVPSRRIFANYTRFPQKYPLATKYYQLLFSGRLGFEKVAEFSSFPSFTLYALRFTLPDEQAEETSTVFDHPVIRIYHKVKPLTKEEYKSLFAK